MKKILFYVIALLALGVAGYAIYGYLILQPRSTVSPAMMTIYQSHKITIVLHALFASVALILGVPQIIPLPPRISD